MIRSIRNCNSKYATKAVIFSWAKIETEKKITNFHFTETNIIFKTDMK